jgi:drug/metabolite transporter (DMT)-like permease
MFAGATLLAVASSHEAAAGKAGLGIAAALGAGVLWGTMYIPYRKAYLTGMNPLSFITFFTVGELLTMLTLALTYRGTASLARELSGTRSVLFWLMLGGFVWVIGDLFQQYATKYVGISRGIPLSNTNQLWGLLWGVLIFHELRGGGRVTYEQVVGGSILMALGAVAIALSSATEDEHSSWKHAAYREGKRYGVEDEYLHAGMEGRVYESDSSGRSSIDWILILVTTALFVTLAAIAKPPQVEISFGWAAALMVVMFTLLAACGVALWRITRFR